MSRSGRSPLQTSTPYGRTRAIASATFSGLRPPASQTGTSAAATIRALVSQSCVRPRPTELFDREGWVPGVEQKSVGNLRRLNGLADRVRTQDVDNRDDRSLRGEPAQRGDLACGHCVDELHRRGAEVTYLLRDPPGTLLGGEQERLDASGHCSSYVRDRLVVDDSGAARHLRDEPDCGRAVLVCKLRLRHVADAANLEARARDGRNPSLLLSSCAAVRASRQSCCGPSRSRQG